MTALEGRRRVLIIGCAGAGKSTLARALGSLTGLPVIHLDKHFWRPGWKMTPREDWLERLPTLLGGDAWIADGDYNSTLETRAERADAVVFLDLPRYICLFRVLRRVVTTYGRVRPDLAEGCPERIDPGFLGWIWRWKRDVRPRVLEVLDGARPDLEVVRLHSADEIRELEKAVSRTCAR